MKVWAVMDHDGGTAEVVSLYVDKSKAEADVESKGGWVVGHDVVDWDAAHSENPHAPEPEELFRPASIQAVVSQPSVTAAMTRAWLAWLAYNQPDTKVSGDEFFEGKLVRSGETAAEAWSRLQHSESEREFLKLQQLVPTEPVR